MKKFTEVVGGLGLGFSLVLAQASLSLAGAAQQDPLAAVRACAKEKDDTQRLACFDAVVAKAPSMANSATVAPAVAMTPVLTKEEKFGLRGELKQEKAKQAPELTELQELQATVTKVASKPHGELILTLDNGQVWYEIQTESGIRVKVGDKVIIRPGALGSYSLVAPNRRSSKVTRAR